jgi:hypothetical protein
MFPPPTAPWTLWTRRGCERKRERARGGRGQAKREGRPRRLPSLSPLLQAALLGLHAALEPLLGTDIAELDANVREGMEREREETRGWQLRGGFDNNILSPHPSSPSARPRPPRPHRASPGHRGRLPHSDGRGSRRPPPGRGGGGGRRAGRRGAGGAGGGAVGGGAGEWGGGGGEAMRKGGRRV